MISPVLPALRRRPPLRTASIAACILAAALLGCAPQRRHARVQPSEPAPGFSLQDLGGKTYDMRELRGEVVLIDFWATYCGGCKESIPFLSKLAAELGPKGLVVLGISIDASTGHLRDFASEAGLGYPVLPDPSQSAALDYGITGIPETFLVGRDGLVRKFWIGFSPADEKDIRAEALAALAG